MLVETKVSYSECKQKITVFMGQNQLGKNYNIWGQANSTGILPDQKSNQS
jgi:hypothetical protein